MTIATILADREGSVVSVDRDTPLSEVVRLLAERRIGAVPVIEDGSPIGILSERDILYALADGGRDVLERRAGEVMTSPAITTTPDLAILHALSLMTRRRIRHLPVVDEGGAMIGFVSIGDLVKARIDRIEGEATALRDYIQMA